MCTLQLILFQRKFLTKRDFPCNKPFISSNRKFNKDPKQICCNTKEEIELNFPGNITHDVHQPSSVLAWLLWPKSYIEMPSVPDMALAAIMALSQP